MDVEKFLSRYETLRTEIDNKVEQYHLLQSVVQRTTSIIRDVPIGGNRTDVFCNSISKMLDIQAAIDDLNIQAACSAFEIGQALSQLPNQKYKTVLTMRYLKKETYSSIAKELDCTERWARSLQIKAKEELQTILDRQDYS